MNFADLKIKEIIINALAEDDITVPTNIQEETIPAILDHFDVIGSSETGTGKTLAYLLPIIQNINPDKKNPQAVILAPTHELVIQVEQEIRNLLKKMKSTIISLPIIGSMGIKRQIENLKKKPQIIVASAGRFYELIKMKKIKMHEIKTIALDEFDRLLDDNSFTQTKSVIDSTLRDRQILAFSASISANAEEKILQIVKDDAKIIKTKTNSVINDLISHYYIFSDKRDKVKVLRSLAANLPKFKALVFVNNSQELDVFTQKLKFHNLKATCLHGEWTKLEREKAIRDFKTNKVNILVASEIAARGLDFKDISYVVNIDIPRDPELYLHRAGRTGRAEKKGSSISVIEKFELKLIKKFEKQLNIKFEELTK